jgi:hypothetical protein
MILGQEKPSLDELVEHSGVKGMKWGVRKKRPTTADIKNARTEISVRRDEINRTTLNLNAAHHPSSGASASAKKKALNDYTKAVEGWNKSDAAVDSLRYTRGEKAALIILTGPLAAIPIGALAIARADTRKKLEKARQPAT